MMYQAHQLAHAGLAAQIKHPAQLRVMVARLAYLDKEDAAVEVIDHLLVTLVRPPLGGVIKFAAGSNDSIYVGAGLAGYYRVVLLR